ncbi:hypothetical protein [Micromonospora sp. NPDC023644]|uniref:hypothetical protein n=1 Tax=Micromonospora sp. NPDC023644 TaxID=3154321 RepID=UPI0033FFC7F4
MIAVTSERDRRAPLRRPSRPAARRGATPPYAFAGATVGVIHRTTIAAAGETGRREPVARPVEDHEPVAGDLDRPLDPAVVDEVVRPEDTRARPASVPAAATGSVRRRGALGNIPL